MEIGLGFRRTARQNVRRSESAEARYAIRRHSTWQRSGINSITLALGTPNRRWFVKPKNRRDARTASRQISERCSYWRTFAPAMPAGIKTVTTYVSSRVACRLLNLLDEL